MVGVEAEAEGGTARGIRLRIVNYFHSFTAFVTF